MPPFFRWTMLFKNMKYKERNQLLKKGVYLMFTLLFLSFIASALFGDSGILVNMRVKTDYETLLAERDALLEENNRLANEIRQMRNESRKIEALGRKTFGFGKPGEVVFYFPPDAESAVERYEHGEDL